MIVFSSTFIGLAFASISVQATSIDITAAGAIGAANPNSAPAAYPLEYPNVDFNVSPAKVKRADIENIKSIIAEISHLNYKREFAENEDELATLERKALGGFANLVSALQSTGILYDVIKTFTSNEQLETALLAKSKREYHREDYYTLEYLDKKDLSTIVSDVSDLIHQSGILSTALNYVETNPGDILHYAANAFRIWFALSEEAYTWLRNSGILDSTIFSLVKEGGLMGNLASQLGELIGSTATSNTTYPSDLPDSYAAPISPSNQPELYSSILSIVYGTSIPSSSFSWR